MLYMPCIDGTFWASWALQIIQPASLLPPPNQGICAVYMSSCGCGCLQAVLVAVVCQADLAEHEKSEQLSAQQRHERNLAHAKFLEQQIVQVSIRAGSITDCWRIHLTYCTRCPKVAEVPLSGAVDLP